MISEPSTKNYWSFWLVCILGLLWNLGGSANYLMQMNLDFVAGMPETHRAIIEGRPAWATGGFAIGVFGGALGCILLMFRSSTAIYLFLISLLGIVLTMVHTVNVAMSPVEFSIGELAIMVVAPVIVAMGLLWFARRVLSKI